MGNASVRRFGVLILALGLLFGASFNIVRANDITLAVTGPTNSVFMGELVGVWLNALNTSAKDVSWNVPENILCRVTSQETTSELTATLRDRTEGGVVTIAPGAFARREYIVKLPDLWTGEVTVELPDTSGTRLVVKAQSSRTKIASVESHEKVSRDIFGRDKNEFWDPEEFFKEHIFGYEPLYFIAGTKSPNAKFQISFKYRLLNEHGFLADKAPWLKGFHMAYTQPSLWDWNAPSAPFFDSSYKPGLIYSWDRVAGGGPTNWFRLDLQGGLQHESNGKDGTNSRSMNIAFLRPTFVFGNEEKLQLKLQPRAWIYLGDVNDNPDIANYRGYAELRAVLGWRRDLQISALGRIGNRGDHGSVQADVTYPLMRPPRGSFSLYLDAQYFAGYGESLLGYKEKSEVFRVGFSLYR